MWLKVFLIPLPPFPMSFRHLGCGPTYIFTVDLKEPIPISVWICCQVAPPKSNFPWVGWTPSVKEHDKIPELGLLQPRYVRRTESISASQGHCALTARAILETHDGWLRHFNTLQPLIPAVENTPMGEKKKMKEELTQGQLQKASK